MASAFLDTNVFVYIADPSSPCCAGSRRVTAAIADGGLGAATSVSVIEELWHLEMSGRVPGLVGAARAAHALLAPVVAVTHETIAIALGLEAPTAMGANDRVIAAACSQGGIDVIVSADRAFDGLPGLRRVDPGDASAVDALLS